MQVTVTYDKNSAVTTVITTTKTTISNIFSQVLSNRGCCSLALISQKYIFKETFGISRI